MTEDELAAVNAELAATDAEAVILAERITRMKAQLQKLVVRRKILSERKARLTKERHQVA